MKILVDASLPALSQCFPEPFVLTPFQHLDQVKAMLPGHQALVCRSTLRVNASLLENVKLSCIATASSGTDHIDHDYLADNNIRLFDAKGSNAHAVVDYVTSVVAWLEMHNTLRGSRVGIVGAGKVGSQVFKRLDTLGYEVLAFDPYLAKKTPAQYGSFEDLYDCDLLCIHANLHRHQAYPSENLFNGEVFKRLKSGMVLINAARGGIVNEADLLSANPAITYCTDVYLHEPHINPCIVKQAKLCTPHIAGHTTQGKLNAVIQISEQLHQHFNLTSANPTTTPVSSIPVLPKTSWRGLALQAYNPYHETLALKHAMDKTQTFLDLRKAHLRSDFI